VAQLKKISQAEQYAGMTSISAGERCLSMREYGGWMDGSPASMSTSLDLVLGQIRPGLR
jgi:hypothetical protein